MAGYPLDIYKRYTSVRQHGDPRVSKTVEVETVRIS